MLTYEETELHMGQIPTLLLRQSGAQPLLPLDLDQTAPTDLALVVAKIDGGGYLGDKFLTLDMA